jgi:hypothetical protein
MTLNNFFRKNKKLPQLRSGLKYDEQYGFGKPIDYYVLPFAADHKCPEPVFFNGLQAIDPTAVGGANVFNHTPSSIGGLMVYSKPELGAKRFTNTGNF